MWIPSVSPCCSPPYVRIKRWTAAATIPAAHGGWHPLQTLLCPSPVHALAALPCGAGVLAGYEDGSACTFVFDAAAAAAAADADAFEAAGGALAAALAAAAAPAPAAATATAAGGGGGGDGADYSGAGYELRFPVELPGHPNPLEIGWNRGEQPEVVAARFVTQNGLAAELLGQTEQFVRQAMAAAAGGAGAGAPASAPAAAGGPFDHEYPVELDQGGKLTPRWNRYSLKDPCCAFL